MGSSVYSSFLLPNLSSGRMTLKMMVVLCLALVVFIEANPVPGYGAMEGVGGRKKMSPDQETGNEMNDVLGTSTKINESEDFTDDSEEVVEKDSNERKRSPKCMLNALTGECNTIGAN